MNNFYLSLVAFYLFVFGVALLVKNDIIFSSGIFPQIVLMFVLSLHCKVCAIHLCVCCNMSWARKFRF